MEKNLDVLDQITEWLGRRLHVVVENQRLRARHREGNAVEETEDVRVGLADRPRARDGKVPSSDRANHPHHISGIAWAVNHARPADHQSPVGPTLQPSTMNP